MLEKLKDLYNLRKQAQEMQGKLASQSVTGISRNGHLHITLNGNQEILNVDIKEGMDLNKSILEKSIKEAFTDAHSKLKSVLMTQFKDLM